MYNSVESYSPRRATNARRRGLVPAPAPTKAGDHGIMQSSHHAALETKHATLDRRIEEESQRPMPDAMVIAELKKQKLKVKEELALG